ncbi:MAG: hypothetical protein Q8N84_02865 [bacterium]|nr:hypothetical protein [bacterium]
MSKQWAFWISIGLAAIVAVFTLLVVSKVEISPELGVAILLAFGVWGLVRGAIYTITGTHIVVGWKRLLWHAIPMVSAALVLVFVGGVSLGGKAGWDLFEVVVDTVPGVSAAKAYEIRQGASTSLDRLILSPVKGIWTAATAPVAREYGDLKKTLDSFGSKVAPADADKKVTEGNIVVYLGSPHPSDPSKFSPLEGFTLGLKIDGVDTKIRSVAKMTANGWASVFSGSDLKVGQEYQIFVVSWPSDILEKQRKEVKQSFTWDGKEKTFQVTVFK